MLVFWTVVLRHTYHFRVVEIGIEVRANNFTFECTVFNYASFGTSFKVHYTIFCASDDDERVLLDIDSVASSSMFQFAHMFPLFCQYAETGNCACHHVCIENYAAKSIERIVESNNRL